MKYFNFKALGLIALLICGVWTTNAYSNNDLAVNGQTSGYFCMTATATNDPFTVSYVGSDGFTLKSASWSYLGGGVNIESGANANTVYVSSQNGTTYSTKFSKYAKGKLRVDCVLEKTNPNGVDCDGNTISSTYIRETSMEIEIRKIFSYPDVISNEIVGPECVKLNEQVTYSIEPWVSLKDANSIGFDNYYWNMGGNEDYYSSDESSITFTVDQNFLTHRTLTVSMGACNPTQTPVSRTLTEKPADPQLVGMNWGDTLCLPLNVLNTDITLQGLSQDVIYTWEKLGGGWASNSTVVVDAQNPTLHLTPASDAREIRLRAKGLCEEKTYDLQINRSFTPEVNFIQTENKKNCMPKDTTIRLSVTKAADGMSMFWQITEDANNDWSIEPGDETKAEPRIHVGSGTARISVVAGCGNAIDSIFYIRPDKPDTIEGDHCFALGDTGTKSYTIQAVPNADQYEWKHPGFSNGSTITQVPYIDLTLNGEPIDTIKVRAIGCSTSDWSKIAVAYNPIKPGAITVPCTNVGLKKNITISVDKTGAVPGTKFDWSIPVDFGSIVGANSDFSEITVRQTGNEDLYVIKVRAYTDCAYSAYTTKAITVESTFEVDVENLDYLYYMGRTGTVPNATLYEWYVNDVFKKSGAALKSYAVECPTTSGSAYVIVTLNTGCQIKKGFTWDESGTTTTFSIGVGDGLSQSESLQMAAPLRSGSTSLNTNTSVTGKSLGDAIVYPNPANQNVTIQLPQEGNGSILLVSLDGKVIKREKTESSQFEMDLSAVQSGNYVLYIVQSGNKFTKKLVVNK